MDRTSRLKALSERAAGIGALALLIIALTAVGMVVGGTLARQVVVMLIMLTAVVGLFAFTGLSGIISFGHVGFVAIGAYTAALVSLPVGLKASLLPNLPGWLTGISLPLLPTVLVSGAVAAVAGLILSIPVARLEGLSAALALLAFLVIVNNVASNWVDVTRGTQTMLGVPTGTTPVVALLFALAAIGIVFAFQVSGVGTRLAATREDAVAAAAVGINVRLHRRVALVGSAFIVGAAGGLYAQFLGSFQPNYFFIDMTFTLLAMLIIGGMTTLSGAIVGTLAVSVISEVLRNVESATGTYGITEIGLALVMLIILLLRPSGLMAGRELTISDDTPPSTEPVREDSDGGGTVMATRDQPAQDQHAPSR